MDFGDHHVGYVTLKLNSAGSPQDAPAFLRLKFAEIANEILEDSSTYEGWISKGWIQGGVYPYRRAPLRVKAPQAVMRSRYLEVLALDTSQKFQVVVEDAELMAVSAVSMDAVKPVEEMIRAMGEGTSIPTELIPRCPKCEAEAFP